MYSSCINGIRGMLSAIVNNSNSSFVPHQPLCPKDKIDLAKVFTVSSTFTSSTNIVAEQKVNITSLFTGDRSTFGPIGTGFKDLNGGRMRP